MQGFLLREALLHFCEETFECFRSFICNESKHLTIEENILVLQGLHESAVGESYCAERSVETDSPYAAIVVLLIPAVCECTEVCMVDRFDSLALLCRAAETVALRLCQDSLTAALRLYSSFYSCHVLKLRKP